MAKLTYDEAVTGLRRFTEAIREREQDYRDAIIRAADAEAVYRNAFAEALGRQRAVGKSVEEAKAGAQAECAVLSRERDVTAGLAKHAAEVLENRRDDRRAYNRLVEWSAAHDQPAEVPQ